MATSSFAGYPFRWVGQRGYFPQLARDGDGVPRLSGEMQLDTEADYKALQNLACVADIRMATGGFIGRVTIQRQKDPLANPEQNLYTPVRRGELGLFTAILVRFESRASGRIDNRFRADVEFVITSDEVTP